MTCHIYNFFIKKC